MDVRCDRCETEYELDDGSVSDAGTSVQCTTCGHTFIVARRPSSPLHQVALTPPAGTVEPSGPAVPEWTLSTDDGKVHRFRDLNTLQKWIVERKASRTDRLSRAGGPWLALGEMDEFASFFKVVDEADRARAAAASPARPTPPAPLPAGRAPSNRIDAAAAEARRRAQSDGPTVPNLRLPEVRQSGTAAPRGSARTPGTGLRASGRNAADADARTPAATPVVASPVFADSGAVSTSVPRPIAGAAPLQSAPSGRRPGKTELVFPADTTAPVDGDFRLPTHRNRNVFLAVAVVSVAAVGAYVWSQQGGRRTAPVAEVKAPAATKAEPVAAEAPAKLAPPAAPEPPTAEGAPPRAAKTAVTAPTPARTPASPSGKLAGRSADAVVGKGGVAGNYDRLVSDADRLLERGQGAKAEKLYEQALNAKPDGVAALTGIAYVMLDKQRHFKAIDMFRRALDVQPTFGPALFGIAESYRGRGDLSQALGAYRQYLAISPSGSDAPAARRQVKDLENVNTQALSGGSASKKDPAGSTTDE